MKILKTSGLFIFYFQVVCGMIPEQPSEFFLLEKFLKARNHAEILNYDPHFELMGESNVSIENNVRLTIAVHGWGSSSNKEGLKKLKQLSPQYFPGTTLFYDCPDAGQGTISQFARSSFGGIPDMIPLLYILKLCYQAQISRCDLIGHSRGAAVVINTLAFLNDSNAPVALLPFSLSQNQRQAMLRLIQNGTLCLQCPLAHMDSALQQTAKNFRRYFCNCSDQSSFFTQSFDSYCIKFLQWLLKNFTRYNPRGPHALDSVGQLQGLAFKTLLYFEAEDTVVSNDNDDIFFERLAYHNPEHTYVCVGNTGKHGRISKRFFLIMHAFRKRYGAAYSPSLAQEGEYFWNAAEKNF